jgi:hypothetical protein
MLPTAEQAACNQAEFPLNNVKECLNERSKLWNQAVFLGKLPTIF